MVVLIKMDCIKVPHNTTWDLSAGIANLRVKFKGRSETLDPMTKQHIENLLAKNSITKFKVLSHIIVLYVDYDCVQIESHLLHEIIHYYENFNHKKLLWISLYHTYISQDPWWVRPIC